MIEPCKVIELHAACIRNQTVDDRERELWLTARVVLWCGIGGAVLVFAALVGWA